MRVVWMAEVGQVTRKSVQLDKTPWCNVVFELWHLDAMLRCCYSLMS